MLAISDFDLSSFQSHLGQRGFLPSHAHRLLREFYRSNGNFDLQELRLGKRLTHSLSEEFMLLQSRITARHRSSDGTIKLLLQFDRGGTVETVLMPAYRLDRAAGCVSSQ